MKRLLAFILIFAGAAGASNITKDSASVPLITSQTSTVALSIGSNCFATAKCNVRFGNTIYTYTAAATVTLAAGAGGGTAYIYIANGGNITVGHNLVNANVTCVGCTKTPGIVAFPYDSVPLYTWTATADTWDTTGALDYRAILSTKKVLNGTGLSATQAAGTTTLSVDLAGLPQLPVWYVYSLVAIANGVNGCANANGCWQVNGVLNANKSAALTQDVVLFALPAKGKVSDWSLQTITPCTGATTATAGLGTTANNMLFRAATYDIAAAFGATNIAEGPTAGAGSGTSAGTNIVASIITTVANVDQLVAGCAVDFHVLWGTRP